MLSFTLLHVMLLLYFLCYFCRAFKKCALRLGFFILTWKQSFILKKNYLVSFFSLVYPSPGHVFLCTLVDFKPFMCCYWLPIYLICDLKLFHKFKQVRPHYIYIYMLSEPVLVFCKGFTMYSDTLSVSQRNNTKPNN